MFKTKALKNTSIFLLIFLVLFASKPGCGQAEKQATEAEATIPVLTIDPQGHAGVVNELLFAANGRTLLSVGDDKTIRLWDIANATLEHTWHLHSGSGADGAIYAAALSPDGQYLALGGYFPDNEIRILNMQQEQEIIILKGHTNVINRLQFSHNGRLLASAGADKVVNLWALDYSTGRLQGRLQKNLRRHRAKIYDIAFSADDNKLVSASADGTLRLWYLDGSRPPVEMKMHIDRVYSCAFSPDDQYIVSGGNKGKVIAWRADGTFAGYVADLESPVTRLAFAANGWLFAAGRQILVCRVPTGTVVGRIPDQGALVSAMAVHQERYLATASGAEGHIIVRDIQNPATVAEFVNEGLLPRQIAVNELGIIALGNKKGRLQAAFDPNSLKYLFDQFEASGFNGAITSSDGYTLTRLDDYTLSTGFKGSVHNDPATDGRILSYTIINDKLIAVGSDYSVKIYDREGRFVRQLAGVNGATLSLAAGSHGKHLYTASTDQVVRVWEVATGNLIISLFVSRNNEWICWTPSGYYQASAGGEKYLGWLVDRGLKQPADFYPARAFSSKYHRPDIVQLTLQTGREQEAIARLGVTPAAIPAPQQMVSKAPVITWLQPELRETTASGRQVAIKARVQSPTPLQSLKILINGRPAPQQRGIASNGDLIIDQDILLQSTTNKIKIFAANEEARVVSEERVITLPTSYLTKDERSTQIIDYLAKPALHVLGIGISTYRNPNYNLTYADDDARAVVKIFEDVNSSTYKEVYTDLLVNEEAGRKSILNRLARLKQKVAANDIVVVFIACHGFNEQGKFYLLPYDGDATDLPATGIDWDDLAGSLGNLPGKVLLMIDACHSGQIGTDIATYQSDNTEAIRNIAAAENGVVVMAASTGDETSLEYADWQHGAFTLSVLEGLAQGKADIKKDLTVFLRELDFYVSERTIELTNGKQHPTTQKPSTIGRFPVIFLKK